jgi:hypothetical protein
MFGLYFDILPRTGHRVSGGMRDGAPRAVSGSRLSALRPDRRQPEAAYVKTPISSPPNKITIVHAKKLSVA